MGKFSRIVIVGIAAGLLLSVWGTLSQLALNPLASGVTGVFKSQGFQLVLLGFFLDLVLGFFFVLAFAIFRRAWPESFVKRLAFFWATLLLIGIAPRVFDMYRLLAVPGKLVAGWAVSWVAESLLVAVLIALLFPRRNAARKGTGNTDG
jgi:hypothetical protein